MLEAVAALLGVAVGIVLGLTGAGGAVLSVPLLTLLLGLPMVEAAPIALLAVTVSAGLGALLAALGGVVGGGFIGVYPGVDFEILPYAFVVVIVELGCRRGTEGTNAHGRDPLM